MNILLFLGALLFGVLVPLKIFSHTFSEFDPFAITPGVFCSFSSFHSFLLSYSMSLFHSPNRPSPFSNSRNLEAPKPRNLDYLSPCFFNAFFTRCPFFFLGSFPPYFLPSLHSFPLCFMPSLPLLFRFHRISFQEPNFDYQCKASSDK